MAKKNDSSMKPAAAKSVVPPAPAVTAVPAKAAVPVKPAPAAKRAAKPVTKAKPAAKATKAAVTKTLVTKPKRTAKSAPSFTHEDVALRAYFISEKRHSLGLPGDEHQDWVEAERQLLAENSRTRKVKKV
jgi:hypothetical protein